MAENKQFSVGQQAENDARIRKIVQEETLKVVKNYMKTSAFTDRKLTDTPTDSLSVVNRKFVANGGVFSSRPSKPVSGQPYFPEDLGYPAFYDGSSSVWVGGTGSVLS